MNDLNDEPSTDSVSEHAPDGSRNDFAMAVALARKGRYQEATRVLEHAFKHGACKEAEALDLQARIHAQQGLLLLAESCWRKAQQLDSSNPSYAAGLEAIRRAVHPIRRTGTGLVVLGIGLFLLIGLGLTWYSYLHIGHQQEEVAARLDRMERSLVGLSSAQSELEKNHNARLAAMEERIREANADIGKAITTATNTNKLEMMARLRRLQVEMAAMNEKRAGQAAGTR